MPRNNAPFPGGPGSPRWRQSTPRCSAAPVWCPVGASLLLGPSGLYVHYIRTSSACQGGLLMPLQRGPGIETPSPRDPGDEVTVSHAADIAAPEASADEPDS